MVMMVIDSGAIHFIGTGDRNMMTMITKIMMMMMLMMIRMLLTIVMVLMMIDSRGPSTLLALGIEGEIRCHVRGPDMGKETGYVKRDRTKQLCKKLKLITFSRAPLPVRLINVNVPGQPKVCHLGNSAFANLSRN